MRTYNTTLTGAIQAVTTRTTFTADYDRDNQQQIVKHHNQILAVIDGSTVKTFPVHSDNYALVDRVIAAIYNYATANA